jgi:hypothetical protein
MNQSFWLSPSSWVMATWFRLMKVKRAARGLREAQSGNLFAT